jgi:hypothetical protein
MQPLKNVSPNWVAPIAVPGFGVYFPSMGLVDIPEPAINWLESIGYVVSIEPAVEQPKEDTTLPKKKRSAKTEVEPTLIPEE